MKTTLFLGSLHGFPRSIFRMYAAGTKLQIDEVEFSSRVDSDDE